MKTLVPNNPIGTNYMFQFDTDFKEEFELDWKYDAVFKDDIALFQSILNEKGYCAEPVVVYWSWLVNSDEYDAGWLNTNADKEHIFNALMKYLKEG